MITFTNKKRISEFEQTDTIFDDDLYTFVRDNNNFIIKYKDLYKEIVADVYNEIFENEQQVLDDIPIDKRIIGKMITVGPNAQGNYNLYTFKSGVLNQNLTIVDFSKSSDKNFVHEQNNPDTTWSFSHNLNKIPSVVILDTNGNLILASVEATKTNVTVNFSAPMLGKAVLN